MPPNDPTNPRQPSRRNTGMSSRDAEIIRQGFRDVIKAFDDKAHQTDADVKAIGARLEALDKLIRGQDDVGGLNNRVGALTQTTGHINAEVVDLKKKYDRIIWWIIGIFGAIVGTALMMLFVNKDR